MLARVFLRDRMKHVCLPSTMNLPLVLTTSFNVKCSPWSSLWEVGWLQLRGVQRGTVFISFCCPCPPLVSILLTEGDCAAFNHISGLLSLRPAGCQTVTIKLRFFLDPIKKNKCKDPILFTKIKFWICIKLGVIHKWSNSSLDWRALLSSPTAEDRWLTRSCLPLRPGVYTIGAVMM